MNARVSGDSKIYSRLHEWIDVVFPEFDDSIEVCSYDGELSDTSQTHDCHVKCSGVDFLSFIVPRLTRNKKGKGTSRFEGKISQPCWLELLSCAARVKALVLWRTVLRDDVSYLSRCGDDCSEMAAQLACISWPRTQFDNQTYIFDKAEDDDSVQGFYDDLFSTWAVDRLCRRVDSDKCKRDEPSLTPRTLLAYAEENKTKDDVADSNRFLPSPIQ